MWAVTLLLQRAHIPCRVPVFLSRQLQRLVYHIHSPRALRHPAHLRPSPQHLLNRTLRQTLIMRSCHPSPKITKALQKKLQYHHNRIPSPRRRVEAHLTARLSKDSTILADPFLLIMSIDFLSGEPNHFLLISCSYLFVSKLIFFFPSFLLFFSLWIPLCRVGVGLLLSISAVCIR